MHCTHSVIKTRECFQFPALENIYLFQHAHSQVHNRKDFLNLQGREVDGNHRS